MSLAATGIRAAEPPTRSVVATPTDLLRVVFRIKKSLLFIFPVALRPNAGSGLIILEVSDHTRTHHSSGRVISSSQRPLPDNAQQSQETDIDTLGGIQTHNPSKRAAADPPLRTRGQWDRLCAEFGYGTGVTDGENAP
jgi:hypothetical protein